MAVKKTKKDEVAKSKRIREFGAIGMICIYIFALAGVLISAYAFSEKGFVEKRLSKYAARVGELAGKNGIDIPYIDATLSGDECTENAGTVSCIKNISDSKKAKNFKLLVRETYTKAGDKKTNITSDITVNGEVFTANSGYEFTTIETKKYNNTEFIVVNLANQDGETYSMVIDSNGKSLVR